MTIPDTASAGPARTDLRRHPERGVDGRAAVHAIVDEALVCHVGLVDRRGPVVIPTTYGRVGDTVYLHGSPASQLLRSARGGIDVCVTITLLDGVVLARSAFHHSMNYRSVVVFGRARVVDDVAEKRVALDAIVDHVVPGRTADARGANDKELAATLVLALPLDEASAKVRTGGPIDDVDDLDLPVWAGVLPLALVPGAPEPDVAAAPRASVPSSIRTYRRASHRTADG